MKKIFTLGMMAMAAMFLFTGKANAQQTVDQFVNSWTKVTWFRFGGTEVPTGATYKQLWAAENKDLAFDPQTSSFDAFWNAIPGAPGLLDRSNPSNAESQANIKGAADFSGSIKVMYDDQDIFIFLQATDDYVTGDETTEIMFAPYYKIQKLIDKEPADRPNYGYYRYSDLGAYKVTLNHKTMGRGFVSAMVMRPDLNSANHQIVVDWAALPSIFSENHLIKVYDRTEAGSGQIKIIYQISYMALDANPALVSPDFTLDKWKSLETSIEGNTYKGISFDLKFIDKDTDDASGENVNSGDYWWNASSNEGYAVTWHSGFLGTQGIVSNSTERVLAHPNLFKTVMKDVVELNTPADVDVYTLVGKRVMALQQALQVNLTQLPQGAYLIKAGEQTVKVVR